jgi:hypothetical protein
MLFVFRADPETCNFPDLFCSGEVLVLKDEYPLIAFGENRTDVKVSELFVGGGAWAVRH